MNRYRTLLAAAFLAVWIWSGWRPVYPHDWLLENILVLAFVPLVLLLGRYFRLSNLSYTLLALFLLLHLIGSHYTYSQVPFGYTLQDWLGSSRNMYDRLVHFSFGFLLAYPMREVFLRVAQVKGFWGFYLPLDVTLSFSAVFEIFEWLVARVVNPAAGLAYLGSQGDIWDAQKDMLIAGFGALLAMLVISVANLLLNPGFAREMRASFRLRRDDEPLGEVRLNRWLRR
jgi:putative membrane protein